MLTTSTYYLLLQKYDPAVNRSSSSRNLPLALATCIALERYNTVSLSLLSLESVQMALSETHSSPALMQHLSHKVLTTELSRAQVAVAEAHFSLRPVGVGVQAGAVQGYYVAL